MKVTIAVDCMGGDHGVQVTLPAVLACLRRDPTVSCVLVGRRDVIDRELERLPGGQTDRLSIRHAAEVIAMDEGLATALRGKKDSSMRVAVQLVRDGLADACVSAGNTGALMAISRFVLKTLAGVDRPAIAGILPTIKGHTYVLDLGANVDSTPEHLLQFGIMCAELVSSLEGVARPSVGLLNIGAEDIKGNDQVKLAAELMRSSGLNFHGYVEGDDIYKGTTDIVVCDGFVGNIALKSSEGLAKMLASYLREEFGRNAFTRLAGLVALPVIRSFKERVDPRHYNGATLLGLRGVVVKSHGSADELGFEYALRRTIDEARSGMLRHITERMAAIQKSAA